MIPPPTNTRCRQSVVLPRQWRIFPNDVATHLDTHPVRPVPHSSYVYIVWHGVSRWHKFGCHAPARHRGACHRRRRRFWGERGAVREAVTAENWGGETPFHQLLAGSCQAGFLWYRDGCVTQVTKQWSSPLFVLAERNETEEMFFSLCLILTGLELWLTETLHTVLTNVSVALKMFPHLYLIDMTTS